MLHLMCTRFGVNPAFLVATVIVVRCTCGTLAERKKFPKVFFVITLRVITLELMEQRYKSQITRRSAVVLIVLTSVMGLCTHFSN